MGPKDPLPALNPLPTLARRTVLLAAAGGLGAAPALRAATIPTDSLARVTQRAAALPQLHGLIVARGGQVVFAEAFRGPPLTRPVDVKSVSKTIVASLAGAALDRNLLTGVDQPMTEVIGDLVPRDADPRVHEITISDLLTMQAGLERTSGANYGRWVSSRSWVAFALSRPFVAAPGERMLYSTGSYHLLGVVLARVGGRSLLALARDWLGDPLGITFHPWTRDPDGFYLGGNGMVLTPLDLVRFGELWRLGGRWSGRTVLGRSWIEASWTPWTSSPFSGDAYGYGWFLTRLAGHDVRYARGYGGQMLYVVPELDLTVAMTSDPTRPATSEGHVGDLRRLLAEAIIPAWGAI